MTIGYFDSNNSNVRSVTLGSSEIRVEYGMYGWKYKGSNRSLSSGTSHIILTADMSDPTYVGANYAFSGDLNDVYYQITYENPASTVGSFSGGIKAQKVTFYGNAYIYGSNLFDTLIFVNGGKFYFERAKNQTIYKAFFSSGTPCLSSGLLDLGTTGSLPKIEVKSGNLNYDFMILKNIDASSSFGAWQIGPSSTNLGGNVNMNFHPNLGSGTLLGLGSDQLQLPCNYSGVLDVSRFLPNPSTTFLWSTGSTTDTIHVSSFGTYSVTVSYAPTCVVSDAIVLAPHDSCSNPLPVQLASFDVNNTACTNLISWQTEAEINNEQFELFKSTNGLDWKHVAVIKGAGNSNQLVDYSYIDNDVMNETTYYYLKQVDFNGRSESFPMAGVDVMSCRSSVTIAPNPATSYFAVKWNATSNEITSYTITDLMGKMIEHKAVANSGEELILVEQWSAGTYVITLKSKDAVVSKEKVIVLR